MKILIESVAVWFCILGITAEANLLDDILLNTWRDKPTIKQNDPMFNPFGLTSLFSDVPDTLPDLKPKDHSLDHRAEKKTAKHHKPWFSFSEFITLPEMHHKRRSETKNEESSPPNYSEMPVSPAAETSEMADETFMKIFPEKETPDQTIDQKIKEKSDEHLKELRNEPSDIEGFSSIPKTLSDILIIFQNAKPKGKLFSPVNPHVCEEYCSGTCALNKGQPGDPTGQSTFLNNIDRICLLVIPLILGIGTIFFIVELRRIYQKMKKQTIISAFDHQEC